MRQSSELPQATSACEVTKRHSYQRIPSKLQVRLHVTAHAFVKTSWQVHHNSLLTLAGLLTLFASHVHRDTLFQAFSGIVIRFWMYFEPKSEDDQNMKLWQKPRRVCVISATV